MTEHEAQLKTYRDAIDVATEVMRMSTERLNRASDLMRSLYETINDLNRIVETQKSRLTSQAKKIAELESILNSFQAGEVND